MTSLSTVRTAVVTGAASGMGRITAERLAGRGIQVLAVDRSAEALASLSGMQTARVVVTDAAAVQAAIDGFGPVDLLVTAAGIGHTAPLVDTPMDLVRRIIEVNYLGTVAAVKAVLPSMKARRTGHLCIYASSAAFVPAPQHTAYNASKAAVRMFTQCLGQELRGTGIELSTVCPPAVATPLLDAMPAAKSKAKGLVKAMQPLAVVEAVEKGLERNRTIIAPGPTTRGLIWTERHAPWAINPLIGRIIGT